MMRPTDVTGRVDDPERLRALRRLGLLDTLETESFDRLTALASDLLGVPVALASLVDSDRQWFKSCVGLPEPWSGDRETPLTHSFCQHVVARREPLVIRDAREVDFLADNLAIPDLNVIAYAGFPLFAPSGEPIGSFCAIDGKPRDWTERDLSILADLAAFAQAEIDLVASSAAAARSTQLLERLQALTDAVLSTVALDDLLERLCTDALAIFGAEAAIVDLLGDDGRLHRHTSLGAVAAETLELRLGENLSGRAAERRVPVRLDDAPASDVKVSAALRASGLRSLLAVPLIARDRVLGTLILGARRANAWSDDDETLAVLAAERLALALGNANVLEREQHVTRELRDAMATAPRALPGVTVTSRYQPAEHHLGGDYFDAFELAAGRVGVVIGDVVGHGVAAAAVAVRLRHELRGALLAGCAPGAAVARLSRLGEEDGRILGSTLLYAELDVASGTVTWAAAGHLPPIVHRASGETEILHTAGGTPLGVHRFDPWPERTDALAAGDRLVLYTDGLVERRDAPLDAGIAEVRSAGRERCEADALADRLMGSAARRDDTALLIVEVAGAAAPTVT